MRRMRRASIEARLAIVGCLMVFGAAPAVAQEASKIDIGGVGKEGASCAELRNEDFTGTEDAPATINQAMPIPAAGGVPAYCQVEGVVADNIGFAVRFPLIGWNGKMVVVGAGGQAGVVIDEKGYVEMGGRPGLVASGYGFVAHDAGHQRGSSSVTAWGVNNKVAMIDYGFRGAHLAGVIGKEVLHRYYGRPPVRAYYHSCSNGGREAMMMAQRYPWDYDGIIAGAPSMAYSDEFFGIFWLASQLNDQSRTGFDPIAAAVLHKSVLAQCGNSSGVVHGVLADPFKCKVNFSRILCDKEPGDNCLTQHQVDIAQRIYEGPRRADGSQIAHSTVVPGSELNWNSVTGAYASDVFRDLAFDPAQPPSWKPDPAQLGNYAKRTGLMDSLFSATDPDLRAYKNRGGKLLIYFGLTDVVGGLRTPIEYYQNVERLMGGEKNTKRFFRLFMMPGMNHCRGGEGASNFDYLGALDRWVETGKAPDVLRGFHPKADGSPQFYSNVKPYRSIKPS